MGAHPDREASVCLRQSRDCSKSLTNENKCTGRFAFAVSTDKYCYSLPTRIHCDGVGRGCFVAK